LERAEARAPRPQGHHRMIALFQLLAEDLTNGLNAMHKIIGAILLVIGVFLLIRGHDLSRAIDSQVKNLFTGSPTGKVTQYYLGGALCCAVGLVEIFRPSKK
jgi:uncharacterized membrane protein